MYIMYAHIICIYVYISHICIYIARNDRRPLLFVSCVWSYKHYVCMHHIYTHSRSHTHTHTHLAHNVCVLYLDLPTFRTYVSYIFPCIIYIFINTHTHTHTHSPRTCSACEMISHAEIQKNVETPGISKLRMHISYT